MTRVGRNQPCPCGSTKKANRCCYGTVAYVDVRVLPLDLTEDALSILHRLWLDRPRILARDRPRYLPQFQLSATDERPRL